MLTCQHVLDDLSDYIDGRLPADELARFEQHLGVCPQCVDYVENFRSMLAACQSLREVRFEMQPPMPEEVVQAILAARMR